MVSQDLREFCETGLITPERMHAVDLNARYRGVSPLQLMESAGAALAKAALEYHPDRVLVLCGKGNNGGDGMVAARYLQFHARVDVICPEGQSGSTEAAQQLRALEGCGVALHPATGEVNDLFSKADVIIDAILGTGVSGRLREPYAGWVKMANMSPAPVISADLPTPGIVPELICGFHRPKRSGSRVVDIGIPLAAECFVGPGDLTLLPAKEEGAHKGAGGEVLVIGGGPYQGAPYLAGLAALRAGADIVRIASPVYLPYPDLIAERLSGDHITGDHFEALSRLAARADVVVIGNGLGKQSHEVVSRVAGLCTRAIIDGDALAKPLPRAEETIYTPHAGEFSRIFGEEPPSDPAPRGRIVRAHAEGATILLKGNVDVISDGSRVRFNDTGHPAMTTGGTGDILAGITGALFCRIPAFEAACIGAFVCGKAGAAAARLHGDGIMPSDLLAYIPSELFTGGKE